MFDAELKPHQKAQLALALRYGVDLPKPAKLKFTAPAFALGACHMVLFSPDGAHLVTANVNGCWLWDVATGTKLVKLKVPSNPTCFAFSNDGSRLLVRNEGSKFAVLAIPGGERLASFTAKYEMRLDGQGCLGPDGTTILQLAYEGMFLVLDATNGKVLLQRQLDRSGYSGEVYWFAEREELVVAQTSVANWRGLSRPCALWRWRLPLETNEPERLTGKWTQLSTTRVFGRAALLLHHQPDSTPRSSSAIDIFDLDTGTTRQVAIHDAAYIIPEPSASHDLSTFVVRTSNGLRFLSGNGSIDLPVRSTSAHFHPTRDLVAIGGTSGFVAPLEHVLATGPALQAADDLGELKQRGYGRLAMLYRHGVPPRLVVFSDNDALLFQAERADDRGYSALAGIERSNGLEATPENLEMLARALARATDGTGSVDPSSAQDERRLIGSNVGSPSPNCRACVAVSFAADAIDLWPMRPVGNGRFAHTFFPVVAIAPDTAPPQLWQAIVRMLGHFRSRK